MVDKSQGYLTTQSKPAKKADLFEDSDDSEDNEGSPQAATGFNQIAPSFHGDQEESKGEERIGRIQ